MSAAPFNSNFNLALGYKQHSIECATRKTQPSSLIRKSWIRPFYFHGMPHHVSFHPKTNRQASKYTLLNVVTSKNPINLVMYTYAYIIVVCATVLGIFVFNYSQRTFACQLMIDGRVILCSSPQNN